MCLVQTEESPSSMRGFVRETLLTLAVALVIFFGLQAIVQDYIIKEYSMEPNFQEEQRVLVNKVVYKLHDPERGDVIVLHPPPPYDQKSIPFIKRIIALPGDTVEIKSAAVYVNGFRLSEPYIKAAPTYTFESYRVPANNYFVLGDNRNNSSDSHMGWTVPRQNIIGKAWLSVWPPDRWGLAANYPLEAPLVNAMR